MAEAITIDVFLRAKNQTKEGVKQAAKALQEVKKEADGAAEAVSEVGESSKKAEKELNGVSESGKRARTGLDHVEKSSRKAKRGLDDMEKSSRETKRILKELANERIMILMEAKDRLTPLLERTGTRLKGLTRRSWNIPVKLLDYATRPIRGLLNMLTSVQGMIFGSAGALGGLVLPMDTSGDYEQTEIAFATMLKNAEKAKRFLEEASDFANRTPFEFPELIDSSKLLLAFGFEAEGVLDRMETIGDTSSGLGAGAMGIERITRALGQMKAKGKVQAEELLQLQEMGIPANQILQEELGLTAKQVANIGRESVNADKAIEALLEGMDKRYGGMMENQSKTAKGLMSTITDTFQNTFMRKWGTGLWEGFKPGLQKITNWLDENQDTITEWSDQFQELAASFSTSVMKHVEAVQRKLHELIQMPEWEQADFFGKVGIIWDELIGNPLGEWWESDGRRAAADMARDIGGFIGTGLNRGIMFLFGGSGDGLLNDGMSAGASFADGFLKGFEPEKIKKVVMDTIKGIFADSYFGGGSSGTSMLSTMLVGAVGLKGLGAGVQIGKGVYDMYSTAKILGGLFKPSITSAPIVPGVPEAVVPGTQAAAAGGLSIPVLASVAGGILAAMGLGASVKDLKRAQAAGLTWDRDRYMRQGLTKGGLVAGGAAAGAAIGSIIPGAGTLVGGLVGGGLGGLTALIEGNSISELFKSERERAHESLLQMGDDLKDAIENYNDTAAKTNIARGLIDEYQELRDFMNSSDFDQTKAEEVQNRMKDILGDLQDMFPGLINGYEKLNGLSGERIAGLEREIDKMDEQAQRHLKQTTMDTKGQIPQMMEDYQEVTGAIEEKQKEWENTMLYREGLEDIIWRYEESGLENNPKKQAAILKQAGTLASQRGGIGNQEFANIAQVATTLGGLEPQSQQQSADIDDMIQQRAAMEEQLKTYYDSSVKLIEYDTGVNLEKQLQEIAALQEAYDSIESNSGLTEEMRDMVEKILPGFSEAEMATEKMDALSTGIKDMKDEMRPALQQIKELNDTLGMLPEEKKIRIDVMVGGGLYLPSLLGKSSGKGLDKPSEHAMGGLIRSAELSWIGEDGPEVIIPLSGKYRRRGLELFEQAGRYMGIGYNAEGGIYNAAPLSAVDAPVSGGISASGSGNSTVIQATARPEIQVHIGQESSMEEIMEVLRRSWSGITDQMLNQIAQKIILSYENTPGGAV